MSVLLTANILYDTLVVLKMWQITHLTGKPLLSDTHTRIHVHMCTRAMRLSASVDVVPGYIAQDVDGHQ